MSEEKLFDVNWDQRKWETPASAQDMKLYSYPPRTIRNMSVPGFLTWLVLLLASIGGLLYTAWMTVTGDYEDGKVNTILGVVSFVVLLCCLIYKTNYKRKLITYTDVLHAVLIDNAKHAYVVHLNEDAFLGATGLGACFVVTYAYKWNGSEYTDTVRFYHSMQDYKELLAYFKGRYEAEK